MSSRANANAIADYYRTYLGREPDRGGWQGYTTQADGGRSLESIRNEIATSNEARDNVTRAQQAQAQAANNARLAQDYATQAAGYKSQLDEYVGKFTTLQGQYTQSLNDVANWTQKAGEYQAQASDWEDQFKRSSHPCHSLDLTATRGHCCRCD